VIVLLGQTTRDEVTHPDGHSQVRTGGAPIFAAEALGAEGIPARIVTRANDEDVLAPLRALGPTVTCGPAEATFVSRLRLRPHGERDHEIAQLGTPFTPEDIRGWAAPALADAETVVLGTQWRDDIPPATIAELRRPGRRLVLDAQGLCRPGLGPVRPLGPLEPAWVEGVDVLKCSEVEAAALLGGWNATELRTAGVPIVVVTAGEEGAYVWSAGRGTVVHVPAERLTGLADTIGAGDMFSALFAAALDAGAEPVAAAEHAGAGVARVLGRRVSERRS
jgi:sugar/nucleoside kinase (ribokinase family)